jgi:hypothetical protein
MAGGSTLAAGRLAVACAFVAQLPFEIRHPLATLGPIQITNLELTGYLLVLLWLVSIVVGDFAPPRLSRLGVAVVIILVGGLLVTSALAMYEPQLSVKVSLRLLGAAFVGAALAAEWRIPQARPWLVGAGLAAAVVSAVLGIIEFIDGWATLGPVFDLFRSAPVSAGGFAVRATGPLLHPNLAGWYWGACGILALGLAVRSAGLVRLLAVLSAAVLLIGATLALSRGALVATEAAAVVAVAAIPEIRRRPLVAVLILAALPCVVLVSALLSPVVGARLRAETVAEWYQVTISAPGRVEVPGTRATVPVQVRNDGPLTWRSQGEGSPTLSYHLYDAQGRLVTYDGPRTELPADLAPGATLPISAKVEAPATAGTYLVEWDLVLEGSGWFGSLSGGAATPSTSRVAFRVPSPSAPPGTAGPPSGQKVEDMARSRALTRSDLWGIAAGYLAERPLIGIGPDNFRIGYGERIGLTAWDTDFNATNLFLEVLTGVGLVIGLVFLLWLAAAGAGHLRSAATLARGGSIIAVVILASLLVHGVFDSFLTFSTAMYLLFTAALLSAARS